MHSFQINASIQIVPVDNSKHAYDWVDEAIAIIRQSKIRHEVGPFATVLEGNYDEIMKVIHDVNNYLYHQDCKEWISSIQIQIRSDRDITAIEKVEKYQ